MHSESLHDLYSPIVIRLIKSRSTGWVGHVEGRVEFWWGNLKEREHLKDVIKLIVKKQGRRA